MQKISGSGYADDVGGWVVSGIRNNFYILGHDEYSLGRQVRIGLAHLDKTSAIPIQLINLIECCAIHQSIFSSNMKNPSFLSLIRR